VLADVQELAEPEQRQERPEVALVHGVAREALERVPLAARRSPSRSELSPAGC
jgi:hypothetical protein